jgi:two-component system cell cycle sensor histidine kinase/response regulator CckA
MNWSLVGAPVSWPRRITLAYCTVVAAAVLSLLLVIAPVLRKNEITTYSRVLSAAADDRAAAIDRIAKDAFADATSLAQYPSVIYAVTGRTAPPFPFPEDAGVVNHIAELYRSHVEADGDDDALLFDRRLNVVADVRASVPGYRSAAAGAARRVMADGNQHSDVFVIGEAAHLVFGVPVHGPDGAVVGAVALVLDPRESVFPILAAVAPTHAASESVIGVRSEGGDLLFSPLQKRAGAPLTIQDTTTAVADAIRGHKRISTYTDYAGDRVLAATTRLTTVPWGLVVKSDMADVLGGYRRNLVQAMAIVAGVLLLIAGVIHTLCLSAGIERTRTQVAYEREKQKAHEELARSYELLSAITESTTDSIFAKDRAGRYVFINTAGAAAVGLTPGKFVGHTDEEIYGATLAELFGDSDEAVTMTAASVESEQTAEIEGQSRTWLVNKAPLRDSAGEITGVIGISKDITQKKEIEEKVRQNEQRFQSLFEHAPIGVMIGSPDGRLIAVNPSFCHMLGYSQDELLGMDVWDITPVEDHALQQEWFAKAFDDGKEVFRRTKRYVRKDGSLIWVYISGALIRANDGTAEYFMVSVDDITERRLAEQALAASEKRFRTLYETMSQGVIYMSTDGTLVDANPAARRIIGAGEGAIKERGLCADKWHALRADGTPMTSEELPVRVALRTGKEVQDTLVGILNKNDGTQRWLLINARPQFENGGEAPSHIYATFTDVTALRETEKALRQVEQSYEKVSAKVQRILEANIVGVVITRPDGSVVEANDYYLDTIGYSRDDLRAGAIKWTDITPPEHLAVDQRALEELREHGVAAPYEKEYIRKDGKRVWVLMGDTVLPGPETEFLGWVINISAQKELHAQFQQAQKMEAIGRLAGGVAHDFNNILTAIRGLAEIVSDEIDVATDSHADLQEIIYSADRATALTRQLLAFSRRQMLQPRNVNLGELVDGIQRMLGRLIGEDIEVVVQKSGDNLFTFADPGQIEQVILNLAVNARDAMPNGGRLQFAVKEAPATNGEGPFVVLSVSDTGCGMDEPTLERIFEPFFTTKDQGKGTGLGLATVYGIVRQSGGRITVASQLDRGTTFDVFLPRGGGQAGEALGKRVPIQKKTGATILLVEDEAGVRNVARRILERRGHTILVAGNGAEALRIAKGQGNIDLIVTDIVMPGMSGPELVEAFRTARPQAKAILMSGYSKDALPSDFATDLSTNFLEKPFSPAGLLEKIDNLLARV